MVGSCAVRALSWHFLKERNARTIEDKTLRFDGFCNLVQNSVVPCLFWNIVLSRFSSKKIIDNKRHDYDI